MTTANLTRSETAARAQTVSDVTYSVDLDLRSAPDHDVSGFRTVTTLTFDATSESTWLDFIGERVDSVEVNGTAVDVVWDGARIQLVALAAHNVVTVRAVGAYSRSGEGLHRFLDPADEQTYLYTQYEPADARRVFACFEQPNIKAPFTFSVQAPEGWTVLSNQSVVSHDGERRTFAPTLPISTYITVIIAGPYFRAESSWSRGELTVPLGAFCRSSLADRFDPENVFTVTKQGLDFFHDAFDYPYPFGKYDQVFVPEYNLGAMENPGCVTFTESYVFRSAATTAQYERRANTILHEMAHMWFGDLVTMEWWDDLWLKESFADYMGALASVRATEFTDAWVTFANRRKAWAYLQDQLPTTHPIVADIPDLEAAKLNFDGITYAKGASVLKQLAAFVGEDAFFAGARTYFRKHAFGNTTLPDLLTELAAACGQPLDDWARAWLQTSGVGELSYDRSSGVLTQSVSRPQVVRVACIGEEVVETELRLTEATTRLDLPDADLILLNDNDSTYTKIVLDERSMEFVRTSLDRITEPLRRGLIWSALWNATRDARLLAAEYVDLAIRFAPTETDNGLLGSVLANAEYAIERYSADRDALRERWIDTSYAQMAAAAPSSDSQLEWFRAFASTAARTPSHAGQVRTLLADNLDSDQRWSLWFALAATGLATRDELDRALAADRTSAGRRHHLASVSAQPDAEIKTLAWSSLTESDTLSNDLVDATIAGFRAGPSRELISSYDGAYFVLIEGLWRTRSIEIARRLVVGLYPQTDGLDLVDRWLSAHSEAPAALRRLVIEQRDHQERALRARAVS
ncbi:aminopeptidase [Rhodococcoides trifolii]|uniref:Aminopeptidase N n=1 Tax=Rhodococcoides trifolii TaxID=908250 RepID=A0A917CRF2_9NOCA|nr:aminopeptidase N [Rhodococcus trifolii]GGF96026.1 aminopeptidase [Rhodococcus trifolii]